MDSTRAYTYIDRIRAVVGNRWIERTWSAFLGNTTSLLQKDGDFEWLGRRSEEYRLVADGEELEVIDFGDTSWSEENAPRGATLVSLQRRPRLEVEIRTSAPHDFPALIRSVVVRNLSRDPVELDEVFPERLSIRRDEVRVWTRGFAFDHAEVECNTDEQAVALAQSERGLFFGRQGGGHFRLFAPDVRECACRVAGPGVLGPHETWRTAATFIVPFKGGLQDAATTLFPQFLRRHFTRDDPHERRQGS